MDRDSDPDIVVAWNSACAGGVRDAVVLTNHGPGPVRDASWTGARVPDGFPKGAVIKDVASAGIDRDGDLDIVATFPIRPTRSECSRRFAFHARRRGTPPCLRGVLRSGPIRGSAP